MKQEGNIKMTCVVDEAVGLKLPVAELAEHLNMHIKLNHYGDGIDELFFVFIAVPDKNTIHENHVILSEAEKNLEIALRLDYQKILSADTATCRRMMQDLFLKGAQLCQDTNLAQFNWEAFLKDLAQIF